MTKGTGHIILERLFCLKAEYEQVHSRTTARSVRTDELALSVGIAWRRTKTGGAEVQLTVGLEPDESTDQPYRVSVTYVGRFNFGALPEGLSDGDFVQRNAAAIMFPYVREAITGLTARGSAGPVVLPPFNVVAMLDQTPVDTDREPEGVEDSYTTA